MVGSSLDSRVRAGHVLGSYALILAVLAAVLLCLPGCSSAGSSQPATNAGPETDLANTDHFLRITSEEPDTGDPQCTDNYYDIALNVFDRLVEVQPNDDGTNSFVPSLADSWSISSDGLVYTFHLHEGVTFSNGSALTASDVKYTLERALTHPNSSIADIGEFIVGADELMAGEADELAGVKVLGDQDFTITLSSPYAAFLAILSIPGASILDEQTTVAAGDDFGTNPSVTIGTGPFVFREWEAGDHLTLTANQNCWSGAPNCEGVVMQFVQNAEAKRLMFEEGKLDILDLENLGSDAEYFMRGDIYQDYLVHGPRIGLSFIALNESIKPLDDVRVRHALQLALDRNAILMGVFGGRGALENGIYPHGLIGFNPDLPQIAYDRQAALDLLAEAGYPDGFDLEIYADNEYPSYKATAELAAAMWEKVGVRTTVVTLDKSEFLKRRGAGELACYTAKFSVDYNDPDAIIYIFFGSEDNVRARGLNYGDRSIIERVDQACTIVDDEERIREYQEIERTIVQEDCAWIPLFSNEHYFVVNERVRGFHVSWNGWTNTQYRDIVIKY